MTKWIALVLLVFGIAGCSSAKKTSDKAEATTEAKTADGKKATDDKAKTAGSTVSSAGKVLCEASNDKRYIEVRTKDAGCEVAYTKFDKESSHKTDKKYKRSCN